MRERPPKSRVTGLCDVVKSADHMRRYLSSLLLLAMLMTSAAPLLALAPQPLPACCRAGGDHHCAAMMKLGGDGFHAQPTSCPFRRIPAAVRAHAALHSASVTFAVGAAHSELKFSVVGAPAIESSYALPKRGPPSA